MSKFKIKLKLEGFELEVEGSKDDIPHIAENISGQFAGLLAPTANIARGNERAAAHQPVNVTPLATQVGGGRGKRRSNGRRSASTGSGNGSASATELFDWKHDVALFGNPLQAWNTAEKAMWLLYVAAKQNVTQEMTGPQIAATFNKHFRQSGRILGHNITRDLGKVKGTPPAKVSEDTTKEPPAWFLTDEGIKHAEVLVKTSRGQADA